MLNPLILNICRLLQRKKHQFLQLGSGTPRLQGMFYVLAWLTVNVRRWFVNRWAVITASVCRL